MTERKHPLAKCEECPLQEARCALSTGPQGAKVALVSRSPGVHDVYNGRPFSGPSGEIVDYLLNRYGVKRDEILTTNVVLCQTDEPSNEAITACWPRLQAELEGVETIIAAGSEAVKLLTPFGSIFSARGFTHNWRGARVIAANNPALVIRESDSFPNLVTDFKLALDPLPDPIFPEVEVINDADVARDRLREWGQGYSRVTATDLEWHGDTIYCAGFSENGESATVFGRNVIADIECFGFIKRFYESDTTHSCWHNGKSDTTVLWRNDICARVDEDTFLLSYALDEEPGRHSLDYCLQTQFGWPDYEPESVKHFKTTGKFDFYGPNEEQMVRAEYELYEYNGWDSAGTYQLFSRFKQMAIKDNTWENPYRNTLLPASNAFRAIELHGFRYDAEGSANILEAEVLPALDKLTKQMRESSGLELLNPRSTKMMAALYYDQWGLTHNLKKIVKGKNKFARSTGKEVREEIEGNRFNCKPEFKQLLIDFASIHRAYAKIERQRSNYFQSLIERVDDRGYIHPWFNLGGTVTGRTSSTDPNFQNITREGVEGIQSVRTLFLPSEGNVLVQADYSQAELRTMAVLSGDPNLTAIYMDSTRSLHKERAAAFYGEEYTKEQYVKSKNINFGVSYGQSAAAFAQMYHMPKSEAQAYIDSWWREFPVLLDWTKEVARNALKTGVVVSPLCYKRRFHLITKENIRDLEREAVNFLPQNTAGGLTIRAVSELVLKHDVPVVNSVHDSIIADVPRDDAMEIALLMKNVMERQPREILGWDLPVTVDVAIGETWASVEEVDLIGSQVAL